MTVTLDINVLLDVFQVRQPHYDASVRVVDLVVNGTLIGVCPAHGLTTIYYLIRKHVAKNDADTAMDWIIRYFQIGNLETADWRAARQLPLTDFEDAVVATVAKVTGSAFIITRDVADFSGSLVSAVTPMDFLDRFAP